jgi:hypothetical protein
MADTRVELELMVLVSSERIGQYIECQALPGREMDTSASFQNTQ